MSQPFTDKRMGYSVILDQKGVIDKGREKDGWEGGSCIPPQGEAGKPQTL